MSVSEKACSTLCSASHDVSGRFVILLIKASSSSSGLLYTTGSAEAAP